MAALPAGAATALGNGIGWALARVVRLRRTYVLETLARCFPEKSPAERRALYAEVCRQ